MDDINSPQDCIIENNANSAMKNLPNTMGFAIGKWEYGNARVME